VIDHNFWQNKKVFITGHTGFKGSWLSLWLNSMGAKVTGYSLDPPTNPSLFRLAHIEQITDTIHGDVLDYKHLQAILMQTDPDIVIHLAAQPLVRLSYINPIETYQTNIMGTVNLLESIKNIVQKRKKVMAVINVTSDKCYENKEWVWGYRENDSMGGYDPYSSSKACSELITSSYRSSFFNNNTYKTHGVALASARAGNVIGGGDWADDRLIPDVIRAFITGKNLEIRNPKAIRPWQHVLESLSGYIILAQKLYTDGIKYAEGWNFGPNDNQLSTVESIVEALYLKTGRTKNYHIIKDEHNHEMHTLRLDSTKARYRLGWQPKWDVEEAIDKIIEWTKAYQKGIDIREICLKQIKEYEAGDYIE